MTTITVASLASWSERICTAVSTDAAEMVRELGIPGTIVSRFDGLVVEPPPPGTIELQSIERDGVFARLDMEFAEAILTHAELEAQFGPGAGGPRVNADSYFGLTYRLDIPGQPYACVIFADFAVEPAGDTPVSGLSLRRQPSARLHRKTCRRASPPWCSVCHKTHQVAGLPYPPGSHAAAMAESLPTDPSCDQPGPRQIHHNHRHPRPPAATRQTLY